MDAADFNVLFIGNSVTECTCAYLYDFLTTLGIPSFNIAALKLSACSLDMHWNNAQNDAGVYFFFRYTTSGDRETVSATYTLKEGILSAQWDWVILSDTMVGPAKDEAYRHFQEFIDYVKPMTTPGKTRFGFNMTWPYELGCKRFETHFEGGPDLMFRAIVSGVQRNVLTNPQMACILPTGTAIYNAVCSGRAPALYRDGTHLNANGCFLASLVTLYTLLQNTERFARYDIDRYGIPCLPVTPHRTNGSFIGALEPEYADLFLEAAAAALRDPLGK